MALITRCCLKKVVFLNMKSFIMLMILLIIFTYLCVQSNKIKKNIFMFGINSFKFYNVTTTPSATAHVMLFNNYLQHS